MRAEDGDDPKYDRESMRKKTTKINIYLFLETRKQMILLTGNMKQVVLTNLPIT